MSSINDFFKQNGITGNPIIDGLIIANLVPIIIAYVNILVLFFKNLILNIYKIISDFIKNLCMAKLIGTELFSLRINSTHPLYKILSNIIIDDKYNSEVDRKTYYRIYGIKSDDILDYLKENTRNKYEHTYDIKDEIFDETIFEIEENVKVDEKDDGNVKKIMGKVFKYEGYYIKFEIVKQVLIISIITFKKINKSGDVDFYSSVIENFMKDRLNIHKKIEHIYSIGITHNRLYKLINDQITSESFRNDNNYKFDIDDGSGKEYYDDIMQVDNNYDKNIIRNKNLILSVIQTNIYDKDREYLDDITISHDNNIDHKNLLSELIKKYKTDNIMLGRGYFCYNNILVLVCSDPAVSIGFKTILVSKKLLSNLEIKNIFNKLIKGCLEWENNKKLYPQTNNKQAMKIYKRINNVWNVYGLDIRNLETIFLPKELMLEILNEFDSFLEFQRMYKAFQIPYRRGLLFHGPPGTGKTSLIKALAYHYQLNIYTININDDDVNDDSICDILNSLGVGSKILLFEDIDSAFSSKETLSNSEKVEFVSDDVEFDNVKDDMKVKLQSRKRLKYLTYSGLLNALDGVISSHDGVVTIMTTNYIEKLGKAFLRPGRIDKIYKLCECDGFQVENMLKYYINKRLDILDRAYEKDKYNLQYLNNKIKEFIDRLVDENSMTKFKPCDIQSYIMSNISDVDFIFDNWKSLDNYLNRQL